MFSLTPFASQGIIIETLKVFWLIHSYTSVKLVELLQLEEIRSL